MSETNQTGAPRGLLNALKDKNPTGETQQDQQGAATTQEERVPLADSKETNESQESQDETSTAGADTKAPAELEKGEVAFAVGQQDGNDVVTDQDRLDSVKEGSEDQSATSAQIATADQLEAESRVLAAGIDVGNGTVTYTSHPISNFRIGRFQFENGVLNLENGDAADLDSLLANADPRTKATVNKIDTSAADRIAASYQNATKFKTGVDTADDNASNRLPPAEFQ